MNYSFRNNPQDLMLFSKNWPWFFAWGVLLILIGLYAFSAVVMATMISVIFIGVLVALGGAVLLADSIVSWRKHRSVFLLHFIIGLLYLIAGIFIIADPLLASTYLTFILGIFYLVIGLFRLFYALSMKPLRWGWNFINGLLGLLLGILILSSWPTSGLFIIGLFVAIDLTLSGIAYVMASLGARSLIK